MANKVLNIEIGSEVTCVAEFDYKVKKPKIYNLFTFATPQGVLENGLVNTTDDFVTRLSAELNSRKITTRRVLFVMNSSRVASRTVQIPNVKENHIGELVQANASDYFPVDLSQYELTYEITGRIQNGDEKKLQLSLLATPKDVIGGYERLAESCGLTLVGLDYMGNSIKKLMNHVIPEEIKATVKVDENSSVITIATSEAVLLQRIVNYGISDAMSVVANSKLFGENLDATGALQVMSDECCINKKLNPDTENQEETEQDADAAKLTQLRVEITDSLVPLIGSISRILDYYQSRKPEKNVEKIYLVGLGSACNGLAELMSNELNYTVATIQEFTNIVTPKAPTAGTTNLSVFFGCIGASVEPVSIAFAEKKNKKAESKEGGSESKSTDNESYNMPILICGICVIVAVVLIAYSLISKAILKSENQSLTNQINQLSYIEEIIAEYDAAVADDNWALAVVDASSSYNDDLVAFIEELEEKMPSEINVLTLSASETSVSLNIEVGSKAAVADVISQLRTFDSILVGNVSTISDVKDEAGISTVSFSVECYYVDQSETDEEALDTSEETAEE